MLDWIKNKIFIHKACKIANYDCSKCIYKIIFGDNIRFLGHRCKVKNSADKGDK